MPLYIENKEKETAIIATKLGDPIITRGRYYKAL